MSRYKVTGPWSDNDVVFAPFIIQSADIVDTKTGQTYTDGAMRVAVDGKAAVRGKGGTVPFYGDMAWYSARNLASDLANAERFVRTV